MTARRLRAALAAVAALALAGCAAIPGTLAGIAEPTSLYILTPKSTFPEVPQVTRQLVVEAPTAAAGINTDRIAVQPNPLSMEFFGGARWVDRAPLMVQTLLIETFENSRGIAAVGRSAVGLRADFTLVTDLREFQARVRPDDPQGPVEVLVRLNLKVVDSYDDRIVGSESFQQVARAASNDMLDVVAAFDEALGRAMRDSVIWSLGVMSRLDDPRARRS